MSDGVKLRCCRCRRWIGLGDIPEADFERMKKIGVKCGDCVDDDVAEDEEGGE